MEKHSSSKQSSSSYPVSLSSSPNSSIADLFGPKDSLPSSSSYSKHSSLPASSSSIFGSVFGPSSMGGRRDSTSRSGNFKHSAPDNWSRDNKEENGKNSYYSQETTNQPCNFSSSIYYGGQEVYSPTTCPNDSHLAFKKDDKDDDPDSASRGNWWQGSLYY